MRVVGFSSSRSRAQRSAGGDFVAPIVGDDPGAVGILRGKRRFGTGFGNGDATGFERCKKVALGGRDAIEADEEEFGRQREVGGIAEIAKPESIRGRWR